jgi:hypothetical protein
MELVEIHVRGHIAEDWSDWLGGLTVTYTQHGETVLSGPVRDQAALRGLLNRIADLGLPLSSVASTRKGGVEREIYMQEDTRNE